MPKKNASALKKLVASTRKQPSIINNREDDSPSFPTVKDIKFLETTELPPEVDDRVFHGVTAAFSPRVCRVLGKPEARSFFGSRIKHEKIEESVTLAVEAESVAARMEHGTNIARQIAAPPEQFLLSQLGLIMASAPDFIAEYPSFKDDLEPAIAWWTTTFPGGGPKSKGGNDGSGSDGSKGGSNNSGNKPPSNGGTPTNS